MSAVSIPPITNANTADTPAAMTTRTRSETTISASSPSSSDPPNLQKHFSAPAMIRNTLPSTVAAALEAKRKEKEAQRRQAAPAKETVADRHLSEFYPQTKRPPPEPQPPADDTKTPLPPKKDDKIQEPFLSIKPMKLKNFLLDGLNLYFKHLRHPSQIPGTDIVSRVYAMGVLPVLIVTMTLVQWGIGVLVILINGTKLGTELYQKFFNDQIALFDDADFIDPDGNDEALRQLTSLEIKEKPSFSYHIANLLLIMSSMAYERDEKLVAEASKILTHVCDDQERERAAKLLEESELQIDKKSMAQFGMRFMGISELKTLGGPFAGLFFNDEAIVLVFKGTSVLAFNEYLIDVTIQRIDASEYLFGEVHKGFYESLFPDPKPMDGYESDTYDRTNPFNTIMETIFERAKRAKAKTGKPVNLWITGHSLGGALAAMVMARLQMPLHHMDPLMQSDSQRNGADEASRIPTEKNSAIPSLPQPTTVWDEMLARFSTDHELIVLRDAYSVASPKLGDSIFAQTFAKNHARFCRHSLYKPAYWRLVADKDIVPRMPPGCSVDSRNPIDRVLSPHLKCLSCPPRQAQPVWFSSTTDSINPVREVPPIALESDTTPPNELATTSLPHSSDNSSLTLSQEMNGKEEEEKLHISYHRQTYPEPSNQHHLHSLLDYQHVGQLVKVFHAARVPVCKPSPFEANMSQEVLRPKTSMDMFLSKLNVMQQAWIPTEPTIEIAKSDSNNNKNNNDNGVDDSEVVDTTTTTSTPTPTATPVTPQDIDKSSKLTQLQEDMARAQELYEVDEVARLREPGPFEQILLSFPSLLSHAPATYQRNLVRARFYFESFPGQGFEDRVDEWVQSRHEEKEKSCDIIQVKAEEEEEEMEKEEQEQDEEEEEEATEEVEEGILVEDEEELHFIVSETKKMESNGRAEIEA
ncbi:hypothetical protein BG004_002644 [Podila humilis]|nr:hypothetical protein BG004_002644 [Podila humilis]